MLRLLCTWHVDKAWQRKLNESKEDWINPYHHLRILLEEKSISKFNVLLQQFLAYLQEENKELQTYFQMNMHLMYKNGLMHIKFGQKLTQIRMYVESFHCALKNSLLR